MMIYVASAFLVFLLLYVIITMTLSTPARMRALARWSREEIDRELRFKLFVLVVAFVTAFVLTVNYAITNFSGSDLRHLADWTWVQWSFAGMGVLVALTVTVFQYSVYSSIQTHPGPAAATALLILAFVIVSEVGTPMEREALKVMERSQESATFQAVLRSLSEKTNAPSALPYADQIRTLKGEKASHESALDFCEDKYTKVLAWWEKQSKKTQDRQIAKCKQKHQAEINRLDAEIKSLEAQQQAAIAQRQQSASSLIDKARQLEIDERKHTAIVLVVAEIFGATPREASMFLSLLLVVAFEAGFFYVSRSTALMREVLAMQQSRPTPPPSPDGGPGPRGGRPAPEDRPEDRKERAHTLNSERARTLGPERARTSDSDRTQTTVPDRTGTVDNSNSDRARTVAVVVDLGVKSLARDLKKAIREGQLKPTIRNMRTFVRKSLADRDIQKTVIEIDEITKRVEQMLLSDGTIEPGGEGRAKYRVRS